MSTQKVTFIGGGNMARSLIGGLIGDGFTAANITVADPDSNSLNDLQQRFKINVAADNLSALHNADTVVLAVKPQLLHEVIEQLRPALQKRQPLLISIAAGVREASMSQWLDFKLPIVRSMPNTAALVQSGATGLFANAAVSAAQRDQAESILRAVGLTLWVKEESQLDAVTALSGSGPAYFFRVMEIMQQSAENLGLSQDQARLLTLQTAFGAAKLALESSDDLTTLRQNVTSKGGTTAAALQHLQQGGLEELFDGALKAAHARSIELGQILGEQ